MSSLVRGGSPSLAGSKCTFLLAFRSISIDRYWVSWTPMYTLAATIHQGNQPLIIRWRRLLIVSQLIPRLLPAPYMCCTSLSEKSPPLFNTHMRFASWSAWLGRTTLRLCWTASTCKYCMPVKHTTMQCTTKQQTRTIPGIICRARGVVWCDVICHVRVCLFVTIVTQSNTHNKKIFLFFSPASPAGVVWCMLSKSPAILVSTTTL